MDNSFIKSYLKSPIPITIVSLTGAYGIAFAIDTSLQRFEEYAGTTFNSKPAILLSLMIPVLVIIGIFALAWLVLRYLPPNRFVAIAYITSGLMVIGLYLSIFVGFPLWLRNTLIGRFRYALMDFGFQASIYYIASACIVIGIAALRRHALNRKSFQD